MAREIAVLRKTHKTPCDEEYPSISANRNEAPVRDHKRLYAQQKIVRQKNLVNRLKLSLLNIYKNLQLSDAHMKSEEYLTLPPSIIADACEKFLGKCVFEPLIYNNISEQFKGKVDFEAVRGMLERNKQLIHDNNKENGDVQYTMGVVPVDNVSLCSGSGDSKILTE